MTETQKRDFNQELNPEPKLKPKKKPKLKPKKEPKQETEQEMEQETEQETKQETEQPKPKNKVKQSNTEGNAKVVYILYLVGVFVGLTGIIGVIMAYIYRADAPKWLQTHYQYQIRTFWIGAVYLILSFVLSFVLIGFAILLFWVVWLCIRSIKGIKALDKQEPITKLTTWMF